MHPVQAAPRQSVFIATYTIRKHGCTPCRQRRGKVHALRVYARHGVMHPVQAAPRQSARQSSQRPACADAPRAGSAEAKLSASFSTSTVFDAPRAGSAEAKAQKKPRHGSGKDAPRAGSAEAKMISHAYFSSPYRCTPCRQRRGKDNDLVSYFETIEMHPVQAAPRQR